MSDLAVSSSYEIELDVFEGPLDLLLHLVRKHELDILDIPISFVTERYIEYLDLMQALNLDVAGEYLLMAATLAYIKSRELLPAVEVEDDGDEAHEEEIDPRQELIRRLLQYQKYKDAAENLGRQPVVGRNVWTRGEPWEEAIAGEVDIKALPPLRDVPVIKLIAALDTILTRAKIKIAHEVSVDRLSVSERINQLATRLESEGSFSFTSCFSFLTVPMTRAEARHQAVVTFLAVLEMAKLGLLAITQPQDIGQLEEDIVISRSARAFDPIAAQAEVTDDYR